MTKDYKAKIFKSGNSVALRLPKALGMTEGMEVTLREDRRGFTVERTDSVPDRIDLTGIWGVCPKLKPLSPDDRIMEPRELDWGGKQINRG
jgi:antitoxin VapB